MHAAAGRVRAQPVDWAANQAEKYEASGGTKANTMRGVPVVILTTRGRRSGRLASHRSCGSSTTGRTR